MYIIYLTAFKINLNNLKKKKNSRVLDVIPTTGRLSDNLNVGTSTFIIRRV